MTATPTATVTPSQSALQFTPKTILFGSAEFGNTGEFGKPKKVTVINPRKGSPVAFGPPSIDGAFVLTSVGCVGELAAGGKCEDEVAYVPTALGDQTGKLDIVSNVAIPPSIALKGKGVPPRLKIKPRKLAFGTAAANSASAQLSVQVTNSGKVPITIMSAAATPPFNVTANTCDVLAAGASCSISVEFAPVSPGKYKGSLQIVDNAARQPQKINLVGTAK